MKPEKNETNRHGVFRWYDHIGIFLAWLVVLGGVAIFLGDLIRKVLLFVGIVP